MGPESEQAGGADALRARNQRRRLFLRRLYGAVDGSVSEFVDAFLVGAPLAMERAEVVRSLEYLAEKGLVKVDDYGSGMVRLTAAGVDAVELE
jgi:hypothetical protein